MSTPNPIPLVSQNQAHARAMARWYPLKEHPVQLRLVSEDYRYKVVPAGRRSGKTERAKRFVVREAMRKPKPYFCAAPTRDQVKRIFWNDLKLLSFAGYGGLAEAAESDLLISFINGATITLVGLDQPQRMEGQPWGGGIVDEIANTKEGSWEENISPALDTYDPNDPDYRAWCWLIGVPEGLNFYYDMAEKARGGMEPDWMIYEWPSSDILPPDMIEAARRRMSKMQFRQEYEGSFENASGKIYSEYGRKNQVHNVDIQSHEQLMWFHDFNFTPLSSGIAVQRGRDLYVLDEIILVSAVARQSALEFVEKFRNHRNKSLLLYGDPAGRVGEKHGHQSDYTEMEQVLRANSWRVERRVKASAPAIKDRQNAVRAKIMNARDEISLYVNPDLAPYMDKGLKTVQVKKGSSFIEEVSDFQHITTALGYMVEYEWPVAPEETPVDKAPLILPSRNPYAQHNGR